MDLFVRYFVELPLPVAAVDHGLDRIPREWLVGMATEAHVRAESLLLEAGIDLNARIGGSVVDLAMAAPVRAGSTTRRPMTWSAVGAGCIFPILRGDLEVGSLGHQSAQLAVSGGYHPPCDNLPAEDRGTALRAGEAALKEFLDRLALAVTVLTREAPIGPPALAVARR